MENTKNQSIMEKITNLSSSIAGSNCADYKRYIIRRQKEITIEKRLEKEKKDKEFQSLLEKNNKIIQDKFICKTLKRRMKRLKKKDKNAKEIFKMNKEITNNSNNNEILLNLDPLSKNTNLNDKEKDFECKDQLLLLRTPKEIETINNLENIIMKNCINGNNKNINNENEENMIIHDLEDEFF